MVALLRMLLVYLVLGAPAALIAIPWTLLRGGEPSVLYRWGMWITALGVRAAGIRVRVEGMKNVRPGTQYIFLSNHVSNLDGPVLLPLIPGRTSVFVKSELMKIPLLGTGMRMERFIPVARANSREDAERSVEAAEDALRSGIHITVFPEGTRSPDGRLLPFKKGAFFLAEGTKAPVIPVVISGTGQMMAKGGVWIRPGEAVVRFLQPIWPQETASREDLMEQVRSAMEGELERQRAVSGKT